MKTRIVYLILNGTDYGGSEKHTLDLFTSLPRDSYDVHLIHTQGNPIGEMVPEHLKSNVYAVDRGLKSFTSLVKRIRTLEPDILHLQAARGIVTGRYATLINRYIYQSKYKLISTTHGWVLPHFKIVKLMEWLFLSFRFLDTKTLAVSEKSRLELINKGYAANKVFTLYNGVDLSPFKSVKRPRTQSRSMGFVGRLVHQKGIETLIKTIEHMQSSPHQFHLYGDGAYREQIQSLVERFGEEKVVYHGFIPSDQVHTAYDQIDLLIAPSIDEGLPYTFIEAMACGVPVIASDVGGVSEIVIHGETGLLIPPNSFEALARAINSLTTEEMTEMSYKCMEMADNFSIEKMVSNTLDCYRSIL